MFTNKTLLITGGTGSFGNAVARRFLDSDLRELRIFSRDEKKQDDMRKRYNHPKLKFYIGDVRELRSVAASRNLEGTATTICGTRYGNVMASRGSVIPLFVEQVAAGKPKHARRRLQLAQHQPAGCGGHEGAAAQARFHAAHCPG